MRNVQETFSRIIEDVPYLPEELQLAVANLDDPSALSHLIAGSLRIKTEEKQQLLEERDVAKRLRRLSEILAREQEVAAIGSRIQSQVQSELDRTQREYVLRQQLKAIQEELGERDPAEAEVEELREQLARDHACPRRCAARSIASCRGWRSCRRPPPSTASSAPTSSGSPRCRGTGRPSDNLDLANARAVLDEDHYDIEAVKDRILEFLAVRRLKPDARGSILCFVGPPGVGKTSLGQSIARALGRKFERISAGGVRDEAEIRGHRRTYIGAMPGTIIRALRDAGSANPLFMIDEIDKMGADYRGDPASALLEVLDPEQNSTFRDHYLDVPFDLSRVMFITTANTLDTVPGPLRDRMEVIQLAGYTEEEKLEIAKRYLVPRQIERSGLKRSQIAFSDAGLKAIIAERTREAGVRNLEREIGAACRKVARSVAEGTFTRKVTVTGPRVRELLGRPRFLPEARRRTREPGVATGLAWTPVGGDVLFVEATAIPGKGKLTVTGQLGDVMRESAQAALSWLRGNADLEDNWFATHDVHVHVPAGAVPKDGPSAGITMATALMSLVTGRAVREDTAMTGEITLTGQVLPIGGLKEKALAAQRAGITRVIAPRRNEADLEDFPDHSEARPRVRLGIGDRRGARRRARAGARAAQPRRAPGSRERVARVCSALRRILTDERWHGSEEEGGQGRRCRRGSEEQPVRPADRRGRGPAREPLERVRIRARGGRETAERQAPDKQIFDDKKLQKDLKSAAESFKDASVALREGPKKKRGGGLGKLILLGVVGAGVALAVSEDLRKKVLDALFGAEEEFEYTSTTAPSTPTPTGSPN